MIETIIILILFAFGLFYTDTVSTKSFFNTDNGYLLGLKEKDYDFLLIAKYGEKIDCNKAQILANRGFYKINNDLCIESFNTKSMDWYYEHHENTDLFMEEFINEYKPQPNTFKILLSHSPNPYFDENNIFINNSLLDNTVINCGHNHGGFVLPFFQDKLIHKKKYGIGLVGPYHRLFTHHAYGFYSNMQSSLIINNAVTKWSDCNGHLMGNIVNSILMSVEYI